MKKQIVILKYFFFSNSIFFRKVLPVSLLYGLISLFYRDNGIRSGLLIIYAAVPLVTTSIVHQNLEDGSFYYYTIGYNLKKMSLLLVTLALIIYSPSLIIFYIFNTSNYDVSIFEKLVGVSTCLLSSITSMYYSLCKGFHNEEILVSIFDWFFTIVLIFAFIITISTPNWTFIIYGLFCSIVILYLMSVDSRNEFSK